MSYSERIDKTKSKRIGFKGYNIIKTNIVNYLIMCGISFRWFKMNELVINAENKILGRLSSLVAKRLLLGDNISIINAEKSIITGDRKSILNKFKRRLQIRTATAPWKGPFHPRMPDRLLRRIIRGMIPWDTPRGRTAYKRLKVYIGTPNHLKEAQQEPFPKIECKTTRKKVYLSEICKEIGWSPLKRD